MGKLRSRVSLPALSGGASMDTLHPDPRARRAQPGPALPAAAAWSLKRAASAPASPPRRCSASRRLRARCASTARDLAACARRPPRTARSSPRSRASSASLEDQLGELPELERKVRVIANLPGSARRGRRRPRVGPSGRERAARAGVEEPDADARATPLRRTRGCRVIPRRRGRRRERVSLLRATADRLGATRRGSAAASRT